MATLTFTPYNDSDQAAIERTCDYIIDGHGNDPYARSSLYIADGHGGSLYAKGYHVVADAQLAATQMQTYKKLYKKNHKKTKGTNCTRADVDCYQLYISFTEQEKISLEQMMQITDELIANTELRNFPILVAPHFNTGNYHVHLVVGAYAVDGSHKLAMKNQKLQEYRRRLDYICVAHGLSIVEPEPMLLRDGDYRLWYEAQKEQHKVNIIPRDKKKQRRSRRKSSMEAAMNKATLQEKLERELAQIERKRKMQPESYFSYPNAYYPNQRKQITVYKYDEFGRERSILELLLMLLFMMARLYSREAKKVQPLNTFHQEQQEVYFGKTDKLAQRSIDAIALSRKYDVTTVDQVEQKRLEVGKKMNQCKSRIAQQKKLLSEYMGYV